MKKLILLKLLFLITFLSNCQTNQWTWVSGDNSIDNGLKGRLITTLANEEMVAGSHEIKWGANDASNKPVPSGVYLLRIEAGDSKETRKISVIK